MKQEDIKAEAEKNGPTVPLPKPAQVEGEKESKLITSSYSSAEAQAAMNAPKKKVPTDFQLAFLLKHLKSNKVFAYQDRMYMITDAAVFDISDLPPVKESIAREMLDALAMYMPDESVLTEPNVQKQTDDVAQALNVAEGAVTPEQIDAETATDESADTSNIELADDTAAMEFDMPWEREPKAEAVADDGSL